MSILKRILYFTIFLISTLNIYTYAKNKTYNNINYYDLENDWWSNHNSEFKHMYELFLNKISVKEDFISENGCYVRFRDTNDKLIIGSSAVVWCGKTMGDEVDKYGFDVVGFGGIPDNKMKEWIHCINKKYEKIIYFSSINTLDVCSYYNVDTLNDSMFEAIMTTIMEAAKDLLVNNGHLSYVKVKEIFYNENENTKERVEFCKRYNKMARELNDIIDMVNIFKIDIKYPMNSDYSAGYVHYNNKIVWEDLFLNVE